MKTLVVYYSFDGNTKKAAEKIAADLSAELLELVPVKEIPKKGMGKFLIGGMKATFGMGTKLQPIDIHPQEYDRIILGTPIWAGKAAPAINEFLKKYPVLENITGLFTCSGGGDNQGCVKQLEKKLSHVQSHWQYTVALADENNREKAGQNAEQLTAFIEKLK